MSVNEDVFGVLRSSVLRVLEELSAPSCDGLNVSQLSRRTGLSRGAVSEACSVLVRMGLVVGVRLGSQSVYSLSPGFRELVVDFIGLFDKLFRVDDDVEV